MAHRTEKTMRVNVPASKIWPVLEDFSSVEKFAITIKSSPIVNDVASGLGAKRLCTFNDGSSLVEEIIDYREGEGYKMALSEYSLPLKRMQSEMSVKEIDADSSEVYMSTDFVVKGGPFGWLMGHFVMRPVMKGVFKKVLSGLAYHAETGQLLGEELPSDEELVPIIID